MATTTALQLVNRFLRKYRLPAVSDFSSQEALAALDLLNDAKEEVLDSRAWRFDEREGVLNTIAYRNGVDTAVTFTNNSATVTGSTTDATELVGDYSLRCLPVGTTDRDQTAHRCIYFDTVMPLLFVTLANPYSGVTIATATANFFVAEYQWPAHTNGDSKVKRLLSMTHQERPLRLVEVDKNFRFDSLVTRLHDTIGSDPEVVYVGRPVSNTAQATTATNTIRDGCIIWPVPTTSERLDYTYLYRHPPLAAETDTLDNVPDNVLNCMVELAYGFSLNTMFGNDPVKAQGVIASAITRTGRLYKADRPMVHRKKPLRSLDEKSREYRSSRRISNDLITG